MYSRAFPSHLQIPEHSYARAEFIAFSEFHADTPSGKAQTANGPRTRPLSRGPVSPLALIGRPKGVEKRSRANRVAGAMEHGPALGLQKRLRYNNESDAAPMQ